MKEAIMYFLSFKSYVVLPIIIFLLAMVFRIKVTTAVKSSLQLGIGFVGIFMTFDYFVKIITPVIQALITRTGLNFNVLDVGWPPLAAITWSFSLAPVLLVIFMVINLLLLVLKLTKVVNIDIWNYWHVILGATMVYQVTHNVVVTILLSSIVFMVVLKLAEWSAPMVNKFVGMEGVCIPHLSGISYFPYALLSNHLMEKIPGFNRIDVNPEKMQKKLGLIGEPMIIGLLVGAALGIGGGYSVKDTSELSVGFAAVIFILPKMAGILGSSLIPISEGMKQFITRKFPQMGSTYIGLDVAILFGNSTVIVTSLLLIPVSLILAFILPGIKFIPLGDLTSILVPMAIISVATGGNLIRTFILGIPVVIANLYIASNLAPFISSMAKSANYELTGYSGVFTSYLDGGNYFRAWIMQIASMNLAAWLLIPIGAFVFYLTWKVTRKELNNNH